MTSLCRRWRCSSAPRCSAVACGRRSWRGERPRARKHFSGVVMATIARSHRIRVSSSRSVSGTAWTVFVAGKRNAIFTGDGAKDRAVDCALRRAQALWTSGPTHVVVEPAPGREIASTSWRAVWPPDRNVSPTFRCVLRRSYDLLRAISLRCASLEHSVTTLGRPLPRFDGFLPSWCCTPAIRRKRETHEEHTVRHRVRALVATSFATSARTAFAQPTPPAEVPAPEPSPAPPAPSPP